MAQPTPLFVERIEHRAAARGQDGPPLSEGQEIRIDAGLRGEYQVPQGARAVIHVLQGSVRFEGDDSPASEGDTVWFAPPGDGGPAFVGIQADRDFRGLLLPKDARQANRQPTTSAPGGHGTSGTETG